MLCKKPPAWFLKSFDALLSIYILCPLVVIYWRGTFMLIEIYQLPKKEDRLISLGVSLIIGVVGNMLAIYIQDWMKQTAHNMVSPIGELFFKRLFAYLFGWVVVSFWRAVWDFIDDQTGMEIRSGAVCFGISAVSLILLRTFRNCPAPPLVAASDLSDDFFTIKTRFRTPKSKKLLFFLDALFSVTVPGTMIVCIVRGMWYIMSYFLDLNVSNGWRAIDSAACSMGIATGMVFIVFMLQRSAAWVSRRLDNHLLLKIIFEDFFYLLGLIAGTNTWRGIWGFLDYYAFPKDDVMSAWTCHIIGQGGLMLFMHASSALVKSFEVDGEYVNGEGCWLPASSLTMFQGHMGQTHRKQFIVRNGEEIIMTTVTTLKDPIGAAGQTTEELSPENALRLRKMDELNHPNGGDVGLVPGWKSRLQSKPRQFSI
ncbi:hypothetical protein BV898_13752 [Hypsibius exemplaris]|uniref:Uncharacterized protein n=1 Tax=Hypsibius exemplaris TaxID=2072580 RepID=A0A1W0W9S8_HYPEX|nr:hypothetical protein BV898_13752 [Hypsibius exemplaris]